MNMRLKKKAATNNFKLDSLAEANFRRSPRWWMPTYRKTRIQLSVLIPCADNVHLTKTASHPICWPFAIYQGCWNVLSATLPLWPAKTGWLWHLGMLAGIASSITTGGSAQKKRRRCRRHWRASQRRSGWRASLRVIILKLLIPLRHLLIHWIFQLLLRTWCTKHHTCSPLLAVVKLNSSHRILKL